MTRLVYQVSIKEGGDFEVKLKTNNIGLLYAANQIARFHIDKMVEDKPTLLKPNKDIDIPRF